MSRAYASIEFGLGGSWLAEYTLTALGAAVVVFDRDGRVARWNTASAAMFGVPEGDLEGLRLCDDDLELVDPDGEPLTELTDPVLQVMTDGDAMMGVIIGSRRGSADVAWRMINLVPIFGPGRSTRAVLASVCDVNDTFKSRSVIADWQWMTHSLLRHNVSAALIIDRDGTIVEWNDRALMLLGRSDADVIGRNLGDVCDLDIDFVWDELHRLGESSLEGVTFVPQDGQELAVFGRFTLAAWPGFGEVVFVQLIDPNRFVRAGRQSMG